MRKWSFRSMFSGVSQAQRLKNLISISPDPDHAQTQPQPQPQHNDHHHQQDSQTTTPQPCPSDSSLHLPSSNSIHPGPPLTAISVPTDISDADFVVSQTPTHINEYHNDVDFSRSSRRLTKQNTSPKSADLPPIQTIEFLDENDIHIDFEQQQQHNQHHHQLQQKYTDTAPCEKHKQNTPLQIHQQQLNTHHEDSYTNSHQQESYSASNQHPQQDLLSEIQHKLKHQHLDDPHSHLVNKSAQSLHQSITNSFKSTAQLNEQLQPFDTADNIHEENHNTKRDYGVHKDKLDLHNHTKQLSSLSSSQEQQHVNSHSTNVMSPLTPEQTTINSQASSSSSSYLQDSVLQLNDTYGSYAQPTQPSDHSIRSSTGVTRLKSFVAPLSREESHRLAQNIASSSKYVKDTLGKQPLPQPDPTVLRSMAAKLDSIAQDLQAFYNLAKSKAQTQAEMENLRKSANVAPKWSLLSLSARPRRFNSTTNSTPKPLPPLSYAFDIENRAEQAMNTLIEVSVWCDKRALGLWEYLLELNIFAIMREIFIITPLADPFKKTIFKTFSIIIQSVDNKRSLQYLFVEGNLQAILESDYDIFDDEAVYLYISLVKSIALRLDEQLILFFYSDIDRDELDFNDTAKLKPPLQIQKFPLYDTVIRFFDDKESFVRIGVRNTTLCLFSLGDSSVLEYVVHKSDQENHFFQLLAKHLSSLFTSIVIAFYEKIFKKLPKAVNSLAEYVYEIECFLEYINEIMEISPDVVAPVLGGVILTKFLSTLMEHLRSFGAVINFSDSDHNKKDKLKLIIMQAMGSALVLSIVVKSMNSRILQDAIFYDLVNIVNADGFSAINGLKALAMCPIEQASFLALFLMEVLIIHYSNQHTLLVGLGFIPKSPTAAATQSSQPQNGRQESTKTPRLSRVDSAQTRTMRESQMQSEKIANSLRFEAHIDENDFVILLSPYLSWCETGSSKETIQNKILSGGLSLEEMFYHIFINTRDIRSNRVLESMLRLLQAVAQKTRDYLRYALFSKLLLLEVSAEMKTFLRTNTEQKLIQTVFLNFIESARFRNENKIQLFHTVSEDYDLLTSGEDERLEAKEINEDNMGRADADVFFLLQWLTALLPSFVDGYTTSLNFADVLPVEFEEMMKNTSELDSLGMEEQKVILFRLLNSDPRRKRENEED